MDAATAHSVGLAGGDGWRFQGLERAAYGLILCDWPWPYETYSAKGQRKSAAIHYDGTIPPEDAALWPVGDLADPRGCVLVFWSTWARAAQAAHVPMFAAWGFKASSGGAWLKITAGGLPCFGTGYVLRDSCEPFFTAVKGRLPAGLRHTERNAIFAERREHSRKPEQMHHMLERLFPDVRRCELFARRRRPGWDVWGNQVEKFAGAAE